MSWTYDSTNLTNDPAADRSVLKDRVRFLVGDTNSGDQLLDDGEILFTLSERSSIYGAAALCCWNLSTKYARSVDSVQGPLRTLYSQKSKNFAMSAARWDMMAKSRGATPGYSGGISQSDKDQREMDSDRVGPEFARGMTDNFLPVAPAGNETEGGGSDESQNL